MQRELTAMARQREEPPWNVLFISFDDMNHYVGFLGRHPGTVSPNLTCLAERGVVFKRAYYQASI